MVHSIEPDKNIKEVKFLKIKRKYPGIRKNLYDYFTEYSNNTGIHGFKYMGEQKRSIIEKAYWLSLFCISLYFGISLIIQTWIKWEQSPVLVSFARSPTPVWQIPFPAVTVCSETKMRQTKYNYTEYYHKYNTFKKTGDGNMTEEEFETFFDSSLFCNNNASQEGSKTTDFDKLQFFIDAAPSFAELFFSCKWTNLNETCSNLITPVLTEDGLCFTFNMLDKRELFTEDVFQQDDYLDHGKKAEGWTLEDGYPKSAGKDTFPRRAMSAGATAGLFLLLRAYEQDLDYLCRGAIQGFKVLLHHPAEVPRVGTEYFRVPLNQEIVVSVKPDMMTTSTGLRNYDPHRRQCFFAEERQLLYFRSYTQKNCQVECVANYTLDRCGCVSYYMPRTNSTDICGPDNNQCVFNAQQELLSEQVENAIFQLEVNGSKKSSHCDCLPACTSISYNAETSQADFNWPKVFEAFNANFSEFPGIQLTRLTIFFKDMQFITSERNELYGPTDFLANCGGLLGLFTGFSFLSIIEISYFLSLRLLCNMKKYGRHYWSGSEDLTSNDAYLHENKE